MKNINHYGKYLPWVGKNLIYQSNDIEIMLMKKSRLEKELNSLKSIIIQKEKEFLQLISSDWTIEEIKEAKTKAKQK